MITSWEAVQELMEQQHVRKCNVLKILFSFYDLYNETFLAAQYA